MPWGKVSADLFDTMMQHLHAVATFLKWRLRLVEINVSEGQYGAGVTGKVKQVAMRETILHDTASPCFIVPVRSTLLSPRGF